VVGVLGARPLLEELGTSDALAEVLPERLLRRHEEHVSVARLVDLVADAFLHARGAHRAAHVAVGLVARHLGLGAFVRPVALAAIPVHVGRGVGLGDLEHRALARLPRADHGGEDAEGADDRARVDADRGVLGDVAEALFVDADTDHARPGVEGDAVGGETLVGPGHAVARDVAEDDLRVDGAQVVVAEAATRERSRPHRLHDDVGVAHQVAVDVRALFGAKIEGDALLAARDVEVEQGDAVHDGPGHLADVVTGGRLDLDHFGAEIGEVGGDGARAEQRTLDHAQACERCGTGRHGRNLLGEPAA
jgi:hypothetical protein